MILTSIWQLMTVCRLTRHWCSSFSYELLLSLMTWISYSKVYPLRNTQWSQLDKL